MKTIVSAAPLANLQGIQDVSGRAPVREPEANPSHLAHVYLFAEKGRTLPQVVSGDSLRQNYGPKTLDPRSPYFNHASVLANVLQGEGNAIMVQRLIPADAGPKARLLLSVDIVAEEIQQYERNLDGTFKLTNGAKVPLTGAGATAPGYKLRWALNDWNNGSADEVFGEVTSKTGLLVNGSSVQSTLYPILELEVDSVGAYGNNLGMRLTVPTTRSATPLNRSLAEAVKSHLFRMQLVARADAGTTPQIVETLAGEQVLEFTFKPNAIDMKTDSEISLQDIFMKAYQSANEPGLVPVYGPFGRMKIYEDNLKTVLAMVGAAEAPMGLLSTATITAASDNLFEVNPFTAQNLDGVPYYTANVVGPLEAGLQFTDTSTFYAAGGSDGTMTDEIFDGLVRAELLAYGEGEADLLNDALYTQSVIYDTGFSIETKKAMLTPLGKRKDIAVILSTQDITQPQNTASEENSMAVALMTAARNFPEAEIFGTPVCRAMVIGHSGYLINSKYKGLLPLTIEAAQKFARYMGAANGVWRAGLAPDMPPNNQTELFRDVNITFKGANQRNRDWATGLVWLEHFDRDSSFFPAWQTVYNDDSSVLNSGITMFACVELEKVAQRTWRNLTGISSLTTDQFAERSDRLIRSQTEDRFDGRFLIVPETYYTDGDKQRGYSWSSKIHLYADNMMSVGTYTVVAHRRSDLNQAP